MITAAAAGTTILGLEGDDRLTGGAGNDVLVGCAGKNTLMGGTGNDVFGVFMDGANADTISDFSEGDEIHLKGFPPGATVTVVGIVDNTTEVAVKVNGAVVAMVSSDIAESGATDAMPPDYKSKVTNMIEALEADNEDGDPVTRTVTFVSAKCNSR